MVSLKPKIPLCESPHCVQCTIAQRRGCKWKAARCKPMAAPRGAEEANQPPRSEARRPSGGEAKDAAEDESRSHQFKVIIIGDGAVGKTSLALRFVEQHFSGTYKQTLGVDFFSKRVLLGGKALLLSPPCAAARG